MTSGLAFAATFMSGYTNLVNWHAAGIILVVTLGIDQFRRQSIPSAIVGTGRRRRGGQIMTVEVSNP